MPDLTSFDSLTPSLPRKLVILVLLLFFCLVLLIELIHGLDKSTRREVIDVFLASFRRGLRQGWPVTSRRCADVPGRRPGTPGGLRRAIGGGR